MGRRTRRLGGIWLVLAIGLAACAADDNDEGASEEPAVTDDDEVDDPDTGDTGDTDDGDVVAADGCESVDLDSPPDEPITIRIGHGAAAEEPFWLMTVAPELTDHQGTWYELDMQPFRATADRLTAYQAGELDAVVITPNALLQGEATGSLDLYAIVTIMREAEEGAFSTSLIALEESGIEGAADLEGATMAIVDLGSHLDVLARVAVSSGGLNPETDAEYVVFPFPAQEDALREGQVDVAGLPEPFYSLAMANGGVVDVANAASLLDFGFDLLTISFDRSFAEGNTGAVCAFREDYQQTMDHWRESNEEARQTLVQTDYIPLPEEIYLQIGDYYRPADGVFDPEGLERFMETMIEFGVLQEDERVDTSVFVLPGVSSGH